MSPAVLFFLILGTLGAILLASQLKRPKPPRTPRPDAPAAPHTSPRHHPARPAPYRPADTRRRLKGRCWVIDGDTIIVERTKIRLAGIDAPELDQPYGKTSKWAMHALCKGHVITVELTGETSHDRLVGVCYLPDGRDLAAELVRQGLALDWALFSNGKYRHLEPPGARRRILRSRYLHEIELYRIRDGAIDPQPSQRS
jgi:endonuclease YncB( thermonuclease family)